MTSTRWPSRSTASTKRSHPLVVAAKLPGIKQESWTTQPCRKHTIDGDFGTAGRAVDARGSWFAVALDMQEHIQPGRGVRTDGASGQPPNGRTAAECGRVQLTEQSQDTRRRISSGPQCSVRVYKCHGGAVSAAGSARHFCGHKEEGTGGSVQEWRA